MTSTQTKPALPTFEQHDVAKAAVRITNAGDGLSDALKVAPKAIDLDDEVFYVLRGVCTQVNHKTDKDDLLTRLHTIKASEITEIDADTAKTMLAEAADKLARAKAEMEGQLMLQAEHEAEERERADEASTGNARSTQSKDNVVAPDFNPGAK